MLRNLYSTFITPWADQSAAHTVEPDFHLPPCYNVQPPPPGPSKAAAFSDETLFFMFYSSPRDALQEVAAQELYVFVVFLLVIIGVRGHDGALFNHCL
jgi:CCR4-NOT transcription complex subunit 2